MSQENEQANFFDSKPLPNTFRLRWAPVSPWSGAPPLYPCHIICVKSLVFPLFLWQIYTFFISLFSVFA